MLKRNKIPTLIGLMVLLIGTFSGVYLLKINKVFKIGANPTASPKDVRITNLTGDSATISWLTEGQTEGFISWGLSQENLGNVVKEGESNQKYLTHTITLTNLDPTTPYFFKINSDGDYFDNNGLPWQFSTGVKLGINDLSIPTTGTVLASSGQPVNRALVYITINGYILSTITSNSGNFILQLANTRTQDLTDYAQIDMDNTLLDVFVQSETGEVTSAKVFPKNGNPIPPMILGQVHDFRNLEVVNGSQNPNADISLPQNATQESGFDISGSSSSTTNNSVILENITEGEVVNSTQPEFFGKGPSQGEITISVHSENVITDTIKIPSNGSWNWSPPEGLAEGSHSITISWLDASGITRTLTRNFIVQAGELPAFTATGSGKTKTPTPTLIPTASPKPTIKPTTKPTSVASVAPVKTQAPESPATGSFTYTILLFIMGVAVTLFSYFVWKTSDNNY